MKLSVIICVFNEIKTISKILEKIDLVELPYNYEKEIIIVDNNSSDGTKEFLKDLLNLKKYKIIFQNKNLGKEILLLLDLIMRQEILLYFKMQI